jgi:hypothetical protein
MCFTTLLQKHADRMPEKLVGTAALQGQWGYGLIDPWGSEPVPPANVK